MRGWLILVVLLAVQGCAKSEIVGDADSSSDEPVDVSHEVIHDPMIDPTLDVPDLEDLPADPEEEDIEAEPLPACGDGSLDTGEECDDGDLLDCNGCSSTCEWERAFGHEGTTSGAVVDLSVAPCLPEEFTVEMWFKLDERMVDTGCYLIAQPGTLHITLGTSDDDTTMRVEICDPMGCSGSRGLLEYTFDPGTWHHLAIIYGRIESELIWDFGYYLDGTFGRTPVGFSEPGIRPCDTGWLIAGTGSESDVAGPCFMTVDEVRISNGVLYSLPFTPPSRLSVDPETIAYWDFNESVAGTVVDQTGHGHDAVILDGALVPDECHFP